MFVLVGPKQLPKVAKICLAICLKGNSLCDLMDCLALSRHVRPWWIVSSVAGL